MDAHANEGQAAVAAMDRRPLEIGDEVRGYAAGRVFRGRLANLLGSTDAVVEMDGAWIACRRDCLERITDD